jgi:hypothetical protein
MYLSTCVDAHIQSKKSMPKGQFELLVWCLCGDRQVAQHNSRLVRGSRGLRNVRVHLRSQFKNKYFVEM